MKNLSICFGVTKVLSDYFKYKILVHKSNLSVPKSSANFPKKISEKQSNKNLIKIKLNEAKKNTNHPNRSRRQSPFF